MIREQRDQLDTIEDNIEKTEISVIKGKDELIKADRYMKKTSRIWLGLLSILSGGLAGTGIGAITGGKLEQVSVPASEQQ